MNRSGALRSRLGDHSLSGNAPGPGWNRDAARWQRHGRLDILWNDPRLTWDEQARLLKLGNRLYGRSQGA